VLNNGVQLQGFVETQFHPKPQTQGEIKVYPFSFLNGVHPYFTKLDSSCTDHEQNWACHIAYRPTH